MYGNSPHVSKQLYGKKDNVAGRANLRCKSSGPVLQTKCMDKVIRKYTNLDDLKAEEYRDWQKLPAHERMNAVVEITLAAYQMKERTPHVPRLQRTLVHLQRPKS